MDPERRSLPTPFVAILLSALAAACSGSGGAASGPGPDGSTNPDTGLEDVGAEEGAPDATTDSSKDATTDVTTHDAAGDAFTSDASSLDASSDSGSIVDATGADATGDANADATADASTAIDSSLPPEAGGLDGSSDAGQGAEAASCDAASCPNGCCSGARCVPYASETNAACGAAGAVCAACPSGETCSTTAGTCSNVSSCTWTAGPSSSAGELTCYWFGQGTARGGGCSSYKTFCGYCGTESGTSNGGVCPSSLTDAVPNTGTAPYFVAFPAGTFGQGKYCGMCVEVSYGSKSVTATVVDECATCPTAGHIDLNLETAVALGLGQNGSTGDATSGVTWRAVDCPISGDIVGVYNNGYAGQIYFQNVVFPVAAATSGGHTATQAFGYWDFGASVAGQPVTLTDTLGHVVTGTIPATSGGSVGTQFPANCQ
jgi:hypothetical protein